MTNPINLINPIASFTKNINNQKAIKLESAWCLDRYDSYDKSNDDQACKFLLNSLNSELEKKSLIDLLMKTLLWTSFTTCWRKFALELHQLT